MKNLTVQFYIESTLHSLLYWSRGIVKMSNDTFEFDDSLPVLCTVAMYHSKLEINIQALDYLYELENVFITSTQIAEYQKIVNQ